MSRAGRGRLAAAGVLAVAGLALAACSTTPPAAIAHTTSVDTSGHTRATLRVLTGTTLLQIGLADFGTGGSLVRVVTPPGAPAARLQTGGSGGDPVVDLSASGAPTVTVTLNSRVTWQLDLGGGTTQTVADLRGGRLAGLAFTAGSSVIDVALPSPAGRVPIRLAGGASVFSLSLPSGVQAQVTAGGGAGEVSLEGQTRVGVAGGSVFSTPGWAPGVAGFAIDATAGAARITVTARARSR